MHLDLAAADTGRANARQAFLRALDSSPDTPPLVIRADEDELDAHRARMKQVRAAHIKALKRKVDDLQSEIKKLEDAKNPADPSVIERLRLELREASAELEEVQSGRRPLF